jgi:hypothetical protein
VSGGGKAWAYLGAVVGGSVSVAANVAHSYVPPAGSAVGWRPNAGSVGLAAFWPLALLLAVEVMARVAWPRQLRWMLVRFLGVTPVAVVAAVVSYRHLSGLLDFYGEDGVTVGLGPLAVDGLMVISTGALLALSGIGEKQSAVLHPIDDPIADEAPNPIPDPIPDPIADPIRGLVADPIGTAPSESGDARLLVLADRVARHSVTAPTDEQADPDDLARIRRLINAGTLPRSPSAEKIMAALKPCGLKRARTIRDAIKNQDQEPAEDPRQGSDITQVPETGPTTATREIH